MGKRKSVRGPEVITKTPTGIAGLDEITHGGLPGGRPTLVCGGPGCGKSLLAAEFLIRGALEYQEPGVLMSFEETTRDIQQNVASLGFDVPDLVARKKFYLDYVHIDPNEIEENGEYDLEVLFIRLDYAVRAVGAKRVVLDTIEALFSGFSNQAVLRAEIRRLFTWLKDRGLTTVITAERGDGVLTRQGLEEYVSDCVLLLDHRVVGQVSTRRMRIVKYRGSTHGTNEYPFLIDRNGMSVLPITMAGLEYAVSSERVSSGVPELDDMLGGKGFYRGSTILLSGTAGTGKSSLSAYLADATCRRGERCLYFSFEESPAQIIRNMRSIGIHLEQHVRAGLLQFHSTRPTVHGLEMHLVRMHRMIEEFRPSVVIVDPVSNMQMAGTLEDSSNMLIRLVDHLRQHGITGFLVSLSSGRNAMEMTEEGLSSMVDTWLLLRDVEVGGERNRLIYVLKSRGMAHSNQVREFVISSKGIHLVDVYLGPGGVLTGSARVSQEARERADEEVAAEEFERRRTSIEQRRQAAQSQLQALQAQLEADDQELARMETRQRRRVDISTRQRELLRSSRQARTS